MKNTLNLLSDDPAAPVKTSPATLASALLAKPSRAAAAAALLVLATVGLWYWWPINRSAVPESMPVPPTAGVSAAPGESPPEGMVYVPGGTFDMGRNDGDNYERPAHEKTVAPFYLDKFEVTCEQYQRFVEAKGYPVPAGWSNGKYPPSSALLPVTGVSWYDASAYAEWAGKRLPTEAEWEFAARGTDGRLYPWGPEWRPNAVNAEGAGPGRRTEVGIYSEGASPFGAYDMVGNVWEWTADAIHSYEGGSIPEDSAPATDRESRKVIRGGCYLSDAIIASATYRRGWHAKGADYAQTGFRCAKTVGPQSAGK
jgi:formylglycine-generating enzyme required for sulfatase activity